MIYLVDWGDTLMIKFAGQKGKMVNWPKIQAVEGAFEALQFLSKKADVYVATSAPFSNPDDIKAALAKVGLDVFISGYFCKANLGVSKSGKEFYFKIAERLNTSPSNLTMIGNHFELDVCCAAEAGLSVIWLNSAGENLNTEFKFREISTLKELCVEEVI